MLLQRKIGESKNRNAPFSPLFSSFNMVLLCARRKLQKKIDTKDKKRLDTKIISINNVGFFVSPRFQLDTVSNQSDELPELRPMIDIPIEPSGDDLHTINQDVLSSLCTEQPGADSPVLTNIQACTKIKITGGKRKRSSQCSFLCVNRPICKNMFSHLYRISYSRFCRLKEHHEEHGLAQRVHGNCKKLPHNALPQAVSADIRNFLTNYVEENAVLLTGRIPGFKKDDIRLLLSSETKMNVWHAFKRACKETGKQAVCYTTFTKLWEQFHPDVVVTKPMTDLCLTCQQNTLKLLRSANLLDRAKSECVLAKQHHLNCMETERDLYKNICSESKRNFES